MSKKGRLIVPSENRTETKPVKVDDVDRAYLTLKLGRRLAAEEVGQAVIGALQGAANAIQAIIAKEQQEYIEAVAQAVKRQGVTIPPNWNITFDKDNGIVTVTKQEKEQPDGKEGSGQPQ